MGNNGYKFEKIILRSLNYKSDKTSFFIKSPTPVLPVQSTGNFVSKGIYIQSALNDFIGVINGTAILIESKATIDVFKCSNLKSHQIRSLETMIEAGGFSYLVVWFQNRNKVFIVDFKEWNYLRKSITVDQAFKLDYFYELKWLNAITLDILNWIKKELH